MDFEPIDRVIIVFVLCLCVVAAVSKVRMRSSGSTWQLFFLSWGMLLISMKLCLMNRWPGVSFTFYSSTLIADFLIGCSIGFVIAIILLRSSPRTERQIDETIEPARFLTKYVSSKVLGALFVIGLAFFLIRVQQTGFSSAILSDLRNLYGTQSGGLLFRIGSHLFVVSQVIVLSYGILDAKSGIKLKRILQATAACAPISLAQGGRTFLIAGFLLYVLAFWCTRLAIRKQERVITRADSIKILGSFFTIAVCFSILGLVRGGYGEDFNLIRAICVWPASSLTALDSWAKWSLNYPAPFGTALLQYPATLAARFGLAEQSPNTVMIYEGVMQFIRTGDSSWNCPPTLIPFLLMEFGLDYLLLGGISFAFAMEGIVRTYSSTSFFRHVLCCQLVNSTALTIQHNTFNEMFFAIMFWTLIGTFLYNRFGRNPSIGKQNFGGNLC